MDDAIKQLQDRVYRLEHQLNELIPVSGPLIIEELIDKINELKKTITELDTRVRKLEAGQ